MRHETPSPLEKSVLEYMGMYSSIVVRGGFAQFANFPVIRIRHGREPVPEDIVISTLDSLAGKGLAKRTEIEVEGERTGTLVYAVSWDGKIYAHPGVEAVGYAAINAVRKAYLRAAGAFR